MRNFGDNARADYYVNYPSMHITQAYFKDVTPYQFWCLAENYPDYVSHMHIQIRLIILDSIVVYHGTLVQMVPSV